MYKNNRSIEKDLQAKARPLGKGQKRVGRKIKLRTGQEVEVFDYPFFYFGDKPPLSKEKNNSNI